MSAEYIQEDVCEMVESYGLEPEYDDLCEVRESYGPEPEHDDLCVVTECYGTEDVGGYSEVEAADEEQAKHAADEGNSSRSMLKLLDGKNRRRRRLYSEDMQDKNLILKIQAALMRVNQYILIDGNLYCKEGFTYLALSEKQFLSHMRCTLPRSMEKDIANCNAKKIYQFLETNPDLASFSLQEVMEQYGHYLALENGILNTRTLLMMPYENYYDKGVKKEIICLRKIAAKYKEADGDAPVWDSFLDQVSRMDEQIRQRIEETMAIMLYPGYGPKKFFVLGTAPDTGKSVVANFLESLFPASDVSRMDLHDFAGKHALSAIYDKTLNISMDLSADALSARVVGKLKEMTGERRIQIESKGKTSEAESTACKLMFGTNFALRLKSDDAAFWKRLELVPFLYSVPARKQNPDLLFELLNEKDAIVSRFLKLLPGLLQNNWELSRCEAAEEMKQQWMAECLDDIGQFLRDRCVITRNGKDFVPSSELCDAFALYLEEQGKEFDIACNVFTRQVRERIACSERRRSMRINGDVVNVVYGIRLGSNAY